MILKSRDTLYVFAGIPAFYLPIIYIIMISYAFYKIFTGGVIAPEENSFLYIASTIGINATLIQWPIYILWIFLSKEFTIRLKLAWVITLVFLNMFAIPTFLYLKYKKRAHISFINIFKNEKFRVFLSKGMNNV